GGTGRGVEWPKEAQGFVAVCFVRGRGAGHHPKGPPAEDMSPVAKSITVYSAGGSVVSGVVDATTLGGRRLRLPPTAAAIHLSQGDQSVPWFTVQAIQNAEKPTSKLIGLPSLRPGELKFNYALPDITWALQLKA